MAAPTGFCLLGLLLVCHGFPAHQDMGEDSSLAAFDDDEIKLEGRHSLEAQTIQEHHSLLQARSQVTGLVQKLGDTKEAADVETKKVAASNRETVVELKSELKTAKAAADSAWKAETLMENRMKDTATSGFNPTALTDLSRLEGQLSVAETQHKKEEAALSSQDSTIKGEKKDIAAQKVAQARVAKDRDAAVKKARSLKKTSEHQAEVIQSKQKELRQDDRKLKQNAAEAKTAQKKLQVDAKQIAKMSAEKQAHEETQKDRDEALDQEGKTTSKDQGQMKREAQSEAKLEAKDEARDITKVVQDATSKLNDHKKRVAEKKKGAKEEKVQSEKKESRTPEVKEEKKIPKEVKSHEVKEEKKKHEVKSHEDIEEKKTPKEVKSLKSDKSKADRSGKSEDSQMKARAAARAASTPHDDMGEDDDDVADSDDVTEDEETDDEEDEDGETWNGNF